MPMRVQIPQQDELDAIHPVIHEGWSCWDMGDTQDPNPSGTPMMMDEFEAEVDLVFTDLNREAIA